MPALRRWDILRWEESHRQNSKVGLKYHPYISSPELRKERKISQEVLAKELGVAWLSYQRYEGNERDPRAPFIKAFADYFNVSTDYLLGRTDVK